MEKRNVLPLILSLTFLLASCGVKGPAGPKGDPGEAGLNGKDGSDGKNGSDGQNGKDGVSIVSITKIGTEGLVDTYRITFSDGTSTTFTVTNGQNGSQGMQGNPGQDGHSPSITIGQNGNWFIDDTDTGVKAEGPKGEDGAPGSNGENGAPGSQGESGPKGADGSAVLTGNGAPQSTLGANGDSYIDLETWNYYVKDNGVWTLKGNIKGASGENGKTPYIGDNGNWWIDGVDTGYKATPVEYVPAIFYDYDGTKLYEQYYEKGSTIVYDGPLPTREKEMIGGILYRYDFIGWDKSLENINTPTIYTAQYKVTDEYASTPKLSEDGKSVTYGLYPQTNINDSSLVASLNAITLPEANGWYLYENEYYAKLCASTYDHETGFTFDNGTTIVEGTTYWFKCEPIKWDVISNAEEGCYIVSDKLLDYLPFHPSRGARDVMGNTVYANNYEHSDIRAWLNNDFYGSAFALGNTSIQDTAVDNSASTTKSSTNPYVSDDTTDKVYFPSYKDYLNPDYGFSTSETTYDNARVARLTDWARAKGAYYFSSTGQRPYSGNYWTRSPATINGGDYTYVVQNAGEIDFFFVNDDRISVRPALTVSLA